MNGIVREEKEFLLTVIGANPALRTIVVSLCKLYRYRDRSYRVVVRGDYGRVDIVNKVRGVMAGCVRYLAKPVVAEDLKAVLHQYIPEMQLH